MPNRDRTGPAGEGPATGRGLGPCKPANKKPAPARPRGGGGGGAGGGRGGGRGRRKQDGYTYFR